MKIAYCIPSLYISGGMERVLTIKANYFADELGYDVTIIMTDGGMKHPYYELSPKVHLIQLNIDFEVLWTLPLFKKALVYLEKQRLYRRKLTECLLRLKPDITVSMLRREINFICDIHDGSIKIGEIHINRDNFRDFDGRDKNPIKKLASEIWMKQLIRQLKRLRLFVCLTEEDKAKWTDLDNVIVMPNPLSFNTKNYSNCEEKRVIAVGRYVPQKGFDLLIEAWRNVADEHPDWSLFVYGEGNKEPYQKLVDKYNLNNCCHLESAKSDIAEFYANSSIFVLSSRFEGFGIVLLEAMSCGVPVVSFACPCGPRDIVHNGIDGLLVSNGDTGQLAVKINYLIENNDERKQMGLHAKENAKRYDITGIGQRWKNVFEKLMNL